MLILIFVGAFSIKYTIYAFLKIRNNILIIMKKICKTIYKWKKYTKNLFENSEINVIIPRIINNYQSIDR